MQAFSGYVRPFSTALRLRYPFPAKVLTAQHRFLPPGQVLDLIEAQTKKVDQRLDALLLVGGFSGSEYLFRRVKVRPSALFGVFSQARPRATLFSLNAANATVSSRARRS